MRSSDILTAIARYHLLTIDTAHRLLAPEESRKEFERIFALEKRRDNIIGRRLPGHGRELYYTLSVRACHELTMPVKRAEALGPQSLVANYSMLLYAVEHKVKRLTREEMERNEKAKPLVKYGLDSGRYALTENGLVLMVSDCGCSTRHLKRKLFKEWSRRRQHPEWMELMDSGGFSIVAITTAAAKVKRLRTLMRDAPVRFDVVAFPELSKFFNQE